MTKTLTTTFMAEALNFAKKWAKKGKKATAKTSWARGVITYKMAVK